MALGCGLIHHWMVGVGAIGVFVGGAQKMAIALCDGIDVRLCPVAQSGPGSYMW